MSNFHKMPNPYSKRGIIVYIMRRHAEEQTGATQEAICEEAYATGRFRDRREVQEIYRWALRDEWVKGLKALPSRPQAPDTAGGISIRDPEAARLARELAAVRKTNMTEAIIYALRAELKRQE